MCAAEHLGTAEYNTLPGLRPAPASTVLWPHCGGSGPARQGGNEWRR